MNLRRSLIYMTFSWFVLSATAQTEEVFIPIEEGFENDSLLFEESTDSIFTGNPSDELYDSLWNNSFNYNYHTFSAKKDTVVLILNPEEKFTMPHKGKVISKYGPRSGRMHTGTDIRLNSGDSVFCAFDGKVRLARVLNGYGNTVIVRHYNGMETLYGHLKSISVHLNDSVKSGDLIGLGGRTGRASCDHLHFETRVLGQTFDSNKYIDFTRGELKTDTLYCLRGKVTTNLNDFRNKKKPTDTYHVVKKGDNLWAISRKYNTTVKQICAINNITTQQVLKIGSIIYLE